MKKLFLIPISLLLIHAVGANDEKRNFKIVSYNVENYFDVVDDPEKIDEEYLPGGIRGWNHTKYTAKQANIAKVIAAIGGWEPPAIVGLCEIESDKALLDLTRVSPLKNLDYKYIHYESPDARGIDVALLYQRDQFTPLSSEPISIHFTHSSYKTRDILYVKGRVTATNDTLHLFVCHFPSRLGGELESESRREQTALHLRRKTDSIFTANPTSNIVIMGDFNDHPSNASIQQTLGASRLTEPVAEKTLYNMAFRLEEQGKGTNKFQGEWGMLDQIIVSANLLNKANSLYTAESDNHIMDAEFLLEEDQAFLGKMPKRTYVGMNYQGGFSDHLPVYLNLWY